MKQKKHIIYLLLLVLVYSCAKNIVDTTIDILGHVNDSQTNKPLSGVSISISPVGKTVTTGNDGSYAFYGLPAQEYIIQASKEGYQTDKKTIQIYSGESAVVDFTLVSSPSKLDLTQSSLDFGSNTTTLSFDILNKGFGTLKWESNENTSWFSSMPTSGTIEPQKSASVLVNVDRTGLVRGNYSQNLVISSNGGSSIVQINMRVSGININFFPEILDFGSIISNIQLSLTNMGENSVFYAVDTSNDWIIPSKKTGVLKKTEIINVTVNRSDHSIGDYEGNLLITVGDDIITVPVKMNIPSKAKPMISMQIIENVTYNSAILKGSLISVGSSKVTRYGFCWSTENNPVVNDDEHCDLGDSMQPKDFEFNVTSLIPSTKYFVKAYAENAEGISYSNQMELKTNGTPKLAEVTTGSVEDIQSGQAIVNGNLLSIGNVDEITQYGHVWSVNTQPTINDEATRLGKTSITGIYKSTLTNLKPNTTYYAKAYAINSIGISYGEEVTFTTKLGEVKIQTSDVENISYHSAYCGGEIMDESGHVIIEKGICYDIHPDPTTEKKHKPAPDNAGKKFNIMINDLNENTMYHVRAYAKVQNGDVFYGNNMTFTTTVKNISIDKDEYGNDNDWN